MIKLRKCQEEVFIVQMVTNQASNHLIWRFFGSHVSLSRNLCSLSQFQKVFAGCCVTSSCYGITARSRPKKHVMEYSHVAATRAHALTKQKLRECIPFSCWGALKFLLLACPNFFAGQSRPPCTSESTEQIHGLKQWQFKTLCIRTPRRRRRSYTYRCRPSEGPLRWHLLQRTKSLSISAKNKRHFLFLVFRLMTAF